eukprot:CAMPEP_0185256814 /NCGR_PEP_ID=MMETSP1359-20130426/5890_1 /TAXON_ID=552665 /ORGANISM="Bigelowiella longifila, Strain CCMP242" /LENGTH=50 /DNA_ID=CAMNT_0027841575 /DNA_START=219 /DNA_END=371 /DNA_ORIENTATION=-
MGCWSVQHARASEDLVEIQMGARLCKMVYMVFNVITKTIIYYNRSEPVPV